MLQGRCSAPPVPVLFGPPSPPVHGPPVPAGPHPSPPASGGAGDDGFSWGDGGHLALDALGFIPALGAVADGANAVWYAAEGNYVDAVFSAAAAVPGAGDAVAAARLGYKGVKAARGAEEGAGAVAATTHAARGADVPAAGRAAPPPHPIPEPVEGMTLWRVFGDPDGAYGVKGQGSRAMGASWTPIDPSTVEDYRHLGGLPNVNTAQFIAKATLKNPDGVVLTRNALPLDGHPGGLPEYIIPDAEKHLDLVDVAGVNEPWTFGPGNPSPGGP